MKYLLALLFCLACGNEPQYTKTTPAPQPTSLRAPLSLWFAGDVHLGGSERNVLEGLRESTKDFGCGIINLEGAVSERETKIGAGKVELFQHSNALKYLVSSGVCVAGIANNHSRDDGEGGLQRTINALRENALTPVGDIAGVARLEQSGYKLALTAHDLTSGVPASLEGDLLLARSGAEILIVSFHVTGPPSYLPSKELREAVHTALRAGARVIVAHGSHMLGPVERRGDAIIAWGLGNVAFSCECTDEEEAMILRVRFVEGSIEAQVVPILAGLKGGDARLVPAEAQRGIFDLLEAIGSSSLVRSVGFASF